MAVTNPMPLSGPVLPRRLSVEEFERIPEGVFPQGERLELIYGLIYTKMGQNDPHVFALLYAFRALQAAFGPSFTLMMQMPARFGDDSRVEPDILALRGSIEDYEGRQVDPVDDVALVLEVSDTSLAYDQGIKSHLYASQGIAEYWIVNLRDRTLEIRRRPRRETGEFDEFLVLREGESVQVSDSQVPVASLLPKGQDA